MLQVLVVDLYEGEVRPLVEGHMYGAVAFVCTHPGRSEIAVSGGEDGTVRMWDLESHRLIKTEKLPGVIACGDWEKDGGRLCVGMKEGGFCMVTGGHGEKGSLELLHGVVKEQEGGVLSSPAPLNDRFPVELGGSSTRGDAEDRLVSYPNPRLGYRGDHPLGAMPRVGRFPTPVLVCLTFLSIKANQSE
jgi:WD40 repeat protein